MNTELIEMIKNPYWVAAVGYSFSKVRGREIYFVDIKNRGRLVGRHYIDNNEIEFYKNIIKESDKAKASNHEVAIVKDRARRKANKEKLDKSFDNI